MGIRAGIQKGVIDSPFALPVSRCSPAKGDSPGNMRFMYRHGKLARLGKDKKNKKPLTRHQHYVAIRQT